MGKGNQHDFIASLLLNINWL